MKAKEKSIESITSIKNAVKDIKVHFCQFEEDREKKQTVSIIIDLKSGEYMSYIGRINNPRIIGILGEVFSFYSNIVKVYFRDYDDHPLEDPIE